MITGLGSARDLASGRKGAFYNTLEEFSKYWTRIDIICPKTNNINSGNSKLETLNSKQIQSANWRTKSQIINLFGNVYVHISPWPLIFHPFWFLKKSLEIYKEQKFDLMTVHEFPPFYNGIGARLLWWKIRVPYVLEIHHIPGYPKAASFKESVYRNLMRWFTKFDVSRALAVRVVNQIQVPEFLIKSGVPKEKIVYIPSMYIDLDIFKPLSLFKEYDLIFVGRLENNKGITLLLEVIRNFKNQESRIKCLVVGDGALRDWVQSQITNYQLPITNYGWAKDQKEIAELMNKSKILIMPSYNEGGPRVILEAMACGVPVLATNVGLIPDFAEKNVAKIIDWNAEDIAQKARELLENGEERERLSATGVELASKFERKIMVKNYADKLFKILED
ncbi:MAG: hypothetical protein A2651_03315 [Candidatus Yanofskybacteria bacterium RIFCSPHIGHO2_01_FULL_42_12]|uniref:Glycosyl transferase family 1 domain-containing protein n=1 Tax=Candidatus Yanofskybacteria bacterium RIFCSPLOWO2_01_FULL_42_49 TaxID=1802694 RepID=A0A1F8GCK4_9BACT|nr:MAG: hypothetical protein A2651_03315 [Candidatus Yanofskybacteria bacterium RIFCSPHIGHO2_01_FULL_42_12]OGN22189.1 MAG: hypothetical protein A2918_03450 [Candidatus Yanofskybacteria bacterium RIFCSPLOWO2_01_FULL_42_49]